MGNRVELMIVTAGTGHRLCQKCLRQHIDLIVDAIGLGLANIHRRMRCLSKPEKGRPDPRFKTSRHDISTGRLHQISGNVFLHENVVRKIFIERADDVIAITPCFRQFKVELVSQCLSESDEIEPMSSPALSVMGRCQEVIDFPLEGIGTNIFQKSEDFLLRWGQAGQIISQPTQQSAAIRLRGGTQMTILTSLLHEQIHR